MSNLKKISCKNCGASLMFDPATQMSSCNFCGTKFEIELAEELEAEGIDVSPEAVVEGNNFSHLKVPMNKGKSTESIVWDKLFG